jgi:uncharacterized protein
VPSERAIVTGASSGIGLEFATLLAAGGYDLVLIARSTEALDGLAQHLRLTYRVGVETIVADLATIDAAARIVERVRSCDVLINNAGFGTYGRFDTLAPDRLREELLLNVVTLTELTRAYLPGMRARGKGRILNVASTAAFVPGPFMAPYYATKSYVLSFSLGIAEEVRGSGVTVTCLCPGATQTAFGSRAKIERALLFRFPKASAAAVAHAGYRAMMRGNDLEIPGIMNKLVAVSPKITPRRTLVGISRKLVEQR